MLKLHSIENGYCRIYYTILNDQGERLIYCYQLESADNFIFYRCTSSGEPSYPLKPDYTQVALDSIPDGDSHIEKDFREWLADNPQIKAA